MTERASGKASNTPPTGTVTFLFTDIEGSTALHENYPDQMYSALKRHDEIVRSNIESHAGYVFKTVGDAFCAAFTTAREAVRAALSAQRALFSEEWPENVTIRVRMGLHTGVAEESEGDYFGRPVNRVARLMSTGHGGQILLSDATHNLVRDYLMHMEAEAELQYLGEHRLKDLRYTERIFQLVVPDLPREFAPLKTHGLVTPAEVVNLDHRYRRIRYVGGGGFGDVYLVRHEALERDMALKVLGRQYAEDEQFKERFKREAKSAAKLNHPNIVQVYDAGEGIFEGQKASYIAMEYVPGGTLEDLIVQQGGPLPPRVATGLTLQVAKALEAAHQNGVIHRDIKPQNILLTESGEAKVTDFGIARATGSSTKLTQTGFLLGTLHYLAPELANGKPASAQSDFYAWGVVLYQMLTGELPFDAQTPAAIMIKHITEPLRPPKEANPNVPERLNAVVVRLLAKEPEERYPDAAALMEDLVERAPRSMEYTETGAATIPGAALPPLGVRVPNLAGKDASRASDTLAEAGLALGDRKEVPSETIPEGGIIRQSPEAGTKAEPGSSVSVTVSSGPQKVAVPDLSGQSLSQARGNLAKAGLSLGTQTEVSSDTVTKGGIIKQEPAAGMRVRRGDTVRVTVSSGPSTVEVPDLTGQILSQARNTLAAANLRLGGQNEAPSDTAAKGGIIKQKPAAGTKAKRGSSVRVTVSLRSSRQRDTEAAEDWHKKGNALRDQGRYEEAIEAYERALRIKPDYSLAWNNKGNALQALGRHVEAKKAFDRAQALGDG